MNFEHLLIHVFLFLYFVNFLIPFVSAVSADHIDSTNQ